MSTEPETDVESDGAQLAVETEAVALQRPFLVEASGPATKRTSVSSGLSEREETELSIVRRAGTLAAFDAFYEQRNKRSWKTNIVEKLLSEEVPENVVYEFDADDWNVQIDGRVVAFHGVIGALADPELDTGGDPAMGDADYSRDLVELHRSLMRSGPYDEADAFADLVDNCRQSPLFGPGAAIATLDAKHAAREDLEGSIERLYEDVAKNGGDK